MSCNTIALIEGLLSHYLWFFTFSCNDDNLSFLKKHVVKKTMVTFHTWNSDLIYLTS